MGHTLKRNIPRVVIVTDPMCSWCWGMAEDINLVRLKLSGLFTFDLMLGGINITSKKIVGAYGRRLMTRLWEEVAMTTGQQFGALPAAPYVHNSSLACLAVETVRVITREAPFDYLHKVQEHFFVRGNNVNDAKLLQELAVDSGCEADNFAALLHSNAVTAKCALPI